jgi:carbon-monoxide dehydrogenase small subunit
VSEWAEECDVTFSVNGAQRRVTVPVRESLADTLRDRLRLTGTHLGCEQGVCGSCTVFLDGGTVRSCTTLAVQADGSDVWTVEGLSPDAGLSDLQQALSSEHGLQCGFCTPGIVVSATELLASATGPLTDEDVRTAMSGNLCRCTGYDGIVRAVVAASRSTTELPEGLAVSAAVAATGKVSTLPEASAATPTGGPAGPDAADGTRRTAVPWPDVAAGLGGLLLGATLRRRRG